MSKSSTDLFRRRYLRHAIIWWRFFGVLIGMLLTVWVIASLLDVAGPGHRDRLLRLVLVFYGFQLVVPFATAHLFPTIFEEDQKTQGSSDI
ncbi:MAG: hypothetical protein AAGH76_03435 [Pseudomonadota bacterium]